MYYLYKTIIIVSFLLLSVPVSGQSKKGKETGKNKVSTTKNSKYIKDYSESCMIGIFNSTPTMQIKINPVTDSMGGKYNSNFSGNFSNTFGFSLGYKVLGVSFGFRSPIDPTTEKSMGKTDY